MGEARRRGLTLVVANRLEEIERVNEAFNDFAERERIAVPIQRNVKLCLDELLNNVVSYGFDDDDEHAIDIDFRMTDAHLVVTLSDDGKPFNPVDSRTPDVDLPVEDRPIGGLGVHLVRKLMERVSYERRGEKNVVRLETSLETEATRTP